MVNSSSTYNTNFWDYYHNELANDLIPAVGSEYFTYVKSNSHDDIVASRNHRAFGGFSMESGKL